MAITKGFSQENNWFYLIIQGCSHLFIKQLKPRFYPCLKSKSTPKKFISLLNSGFQLPQST